MEDLNNETVSKIAIEGWTQQEMFNLYQALKNCDLRDIKNIQEYVSTKSYDEIKAALDNYIQKALQHPVFEQNLMEPKTRKSRKPQAPLPSWAKLLTDSLHYDEICTETATAVRLIADLDNIPSPASTNNIDFRQIYHQIANALEGKPLTADLETTAVLNKCIVETALSCKAFIKTAAVKSVISSIDLADTEINSFPKATENHELAILRHLAAQRSYNPFNIPEEYLKPSCETSINFCKSKRD